MRRVLLGGRSLDMGEGGESLRFLRGREGIPGICGAGGGFPVCHVLLGGRSLDIGGGSH